MLGFCAAMVPIYRQICAAIGITQQRAVTADGQHPGGHEPRGEGGAARLHARGCLGRFEALDRSVVAASRRVRDGALSRGEHARARPVTAHAVMSTAPHHRPRATSRSRRASASPTQTLAAGRGARDAGGLPREGRRAADLRRSRSRTRSWRCPRHEHVRDAFRAVFWSFFGVRKHAEYEKDTQRLKPQHVIAAGLVAALRSCWRCSAS